jgi:16S rRNA (uracil1498-N3)-methyltransferase
MNQTPSSTGLFPYEGESEQTVSSAIQKMKGEAFENIWVFVGSEGGFSDQEVEFFKENGLKSSSLGDQVLRVETACLALVSILKYEFNS